MIFRGLDKPPRIIVEIEVEVRPEIKLPEYKGMKVKVDVIKVDKAEVEVEIDRLDQLEEAISAGVEEVLLDNMTPEQCREAVRITNGRVKLEASGGISLDRVREYAEAGVDYIAVGAITHSAPILDIGLDISEVK